MTSRELTSGFNFWSCPWCIILPNLIQISFSNMKLLTFSRNPRWRPPPTWIFKLSAFGTFRRVESIVLELCAKFGSNICYSHWDRRTYAPDVHLMTSRETTSGFDFWWSGHLRMAMMHLTTKFGVDIFIQSWVIDIFPKFKMAAAAIFDLLKEDMGPPTKAYAWCVTHVKISSWWAK